MILVFHLYNYSFLIGIQSIYINYFNNLFTTMVNHQLFSQEELHHSVKDIPNHILNAEDAEE
jgi:hypothetical protein